MPYLCHWINLYHAIPHSYETWHTHTHIHTHTHYDPKRGKTWQDWQDSSTHWKACRIDCLQPFCIPLPVQGLLEWLRYHSTISFRFLFGLPDLRSREGKLNLETAAVQTWCAETTDRGNQRSRLWCWVGAEWWHSTLQALRFRSMFTSVLTFIDLESSQSWAKKGKEHTYPNKVARN